MNLKKPLSLIFIVVLISACSGGKNWLPDTLGGMNLKERVAGKEATARVDKIHFNSVAADKENEIGYYDSPENSAVIYLTYYKDDSAAKADFEKMTKKISPENSVFISPGYIEVEGYNMYRCYGMGQAHYVFVHNNLLIWLSTGTVGSRKVLDEYIKFIK